jgi:hypothetical protein
MHSGACEEPSAFLAIFTEHLFSMRVTFRSDDFWERQLPGTRQVSTLNPKHSTLNPNLSALSVTPRPITSEHFKTRCFMPKRVCDTDCWGGRLVMFGVFLVPIWNSIQKQFQENPHVCALYDPA